VGGGHVRANGHPLDEPDFIVDQAERFVVIMKGRKSTPWPRPGQRLVTIEFPQDGGEV